MLVIDGLISTFNVSLWGSNDRALSRLTVDRPLQLFHLPYS